jgi:hypothetical protein
MSEAATIVTIQGVNYDLNSLSQEAKVYLAQISAIDTEIQRLNARKAIYETARNTYFSHLVAQLPEPAAAEPPAANA